MKRQTSTVLSTVTMPEYNVKPMISFHRTRLCSTKITGTANLAKDVAPNLNHSVVLRSWHPCSTAHTKCRLCACTRGQSGTLGRTTSRKTIALATLTQRAQSRSSSIKLHIVLIGSLITLKSMFDLGNMRTSPFVL